ncbi:patched domain-containing protein 3-like [Centruroides sculpturatus]|uniref:patched domain-containing protein 3-like n=1 Tax=Centruroides sculpturatus TaxID=218467 RepID=UPI000C6EAB3A|nr:patched domain-containing protein 3-like [Centruroides sculpturatus]
MKLKAFSEYLSKKFKYLGRYVATNPSYFIVVPVFVSVILFTGFQKFHEENDLKHLIGPTNGRFINQEAVIERLFPMDLSYNASLQGMNREGCIAIVIITAKDEGSVLRKDLFEEVLQLNTIIQNITLEDFEKLRYKDICAKNNGRCFENSILLLEDKIKEMEGGVEVDDDDNVKTAKSVRLFYYLNDGSTYKKFIAKKWLNLFLDTLAEMDFQNININRYTSLTIEKELNGLAVKIIPRLSVAIVVILVFSVITCLFNNWIESKPWMGLIALLSSGMALASSFGVVMYFNQPFAASTGSIPFLILGIGMDDAFVFLAAWKRTDSTMSVVNRMEKVYSESAISVTITSVTNFIAFVSGLVTSYRIVKNFCMYASLAVVFCYVYQLTFVGACMALTGYLEKQNRHSLFLIKLDKPNENQTWIRRFFCTNWSWKSENGRKNSISSIWIHLGNILSICYVKIIVVLIMFGQISVGIWGITKTQNVGNFAECVTYDSYFVKYHKNYYEYFNRYNLRYQIIIDEEIDYANKNIQEQIEKLVTDMQNEDLIEDSLTESWLRSYLEFLNNKNVSNIIRLFNINDKEDFITVLRKLFLRHPATRHFTNDIVFNSNYTSIIGSRFFCQSKIINSHKEFVNVMKSMRNIADNSPFNVFPYHFLSYTVDDSEQHVSFITQILSSIVVIVIIVCFIFIPDGIIIFSVAFSIISTETCALGFMALWNVRLTPVSIIILVMCAGFCADFSAHFAHCYVENDSEDHNKRLRNTICSIGLAIFQGSVTTIFSIIPLAFPLASTFLTAFKVIFLVTSFSALNALVYLPVLLVIMNTMKQKLCRNKKTDINNNTSKSVNGNINPGYQFTETSIRL